MRKNIEIWNEIKEIIGEKIKTFNLDESKMQDGIYYLNANDGTEFDILVNNNMCEIAKLYNDDYIAVKIYCERNGNLLIYTFNDKYECIDEDKINNFMSEDEFMEFASNVCSYTDDKEVWNSIIDESIFSKEYEVKDFFYDEDTEDEDEEDY